MWWWSFYIKQKIECQNIVGWYVIIIKYLDTYQKNAFYDHDVMFRSDPKQNICFDKLRKFLLALHHGCVRLPEEKNSTAFFIYFTLLDFSNQISE